MMRHCLDDLIRGQFAPLGQQVAQCGLGDLLRERLVCQAR